MNVEHFFSLPVFISSVDSDIIKNSLASAKSFYSRYEDDQAFTTYHSPDRDYAGTVSDLALLNTIEENCNKFLNYLGYKTNGNIIENWLNVNPYLTGHDVHQHYGSIISGVLYLDVAENCGDLIFYDPIKERQQHRAHYKKYQKLDNDDYFSTYHFKPVVGNIIIFESWLSHSVSLNFSNKKRFSVAFNLRKS